MSRKGETVLLSENAFCFFSFMKWMTNFSTCFRTNCALWSYFSHAARFLVLSLWARPCAWIFWPQCWYCWAGYDGFLRQHYLILRPTATWIKFINSHLPPLRDKPCTLNVTLLSQFSTLLDPTRALCSLLTLQFSLHWLATILIPSSLSIALTGWIPCNLPT